MNIKEFLLQNYIWIIVVILLLIITIIGFLVDKKDRPKKESKNNIPQQPVNQMSNIPPLNYQNVPNQFNYQDNITNGINMQNNINQPNMFTYPNMANSNISNFNNSENLNQTIAYPNSVNPQTLNNPNLTMNGNLTPNAINDQPPIISFPNDNLNSQNLNQVGNANSNLQFNNLQNDQNLQNQVNPNLDSNPNIVNNPYSNMIYPNNNVTSNQNLTPNINNGQPFSPMANQELLNQIPVNNTEQSLPLSNQNFVIDNNKNDSTIGMQNNNNMQNSNNLYGNQNILNNEEQINNNNNINNSQGSISTNSQPINFVYGNNNQNNQ